MATAEVDLGPCQCPGSPHERDEATVRWQIGASALSRIGRAELSRAVDKDPMAAYRQVVIETVVSWNLLWLEPTSTDPDRHAVPVPVIPATVAELDQDTLKKLAESADALLSNEGVLPNASGAPSVELSPESASPTPRSTKKPTT